MKKSVALLSGLVLSSTLFGGVVMAQDVGSTAIVRVPAESGSYCHMKFPALREDTLAWSQPVFDEAAGPIVDFYGSCNHDPLGIDEIRTQRRLMNQHDE